MIDTIRNNPVLATTVLAIGAIAVVAFVIGGDGMIETLNFVPVSYDSVVDLLTPILLVALLVERTVEVFVSTGRKLKRGEKERALMRAKAKLEQLEERLGLFQEQLKTPGASDVADADGTTLKDRINNVNKLLPGAQRDERTAQSELEDFRGQTQRVSFVVGTLFGLIVALAGIRVVSPLVDFQLANWSKLQEIVFHSLDVVFTAGLLAGGASGIHQVLSVFGDFTDQTRRKTQAT